MIRPFFFGVQILIIFACTNISILYASEPEGNYILSPRIGIRTEVIDNKVVVVEVVNNQVAERAGIRKGDIIVAIDGRKITSRKTLLDALDLKQPGDHVTLVIDRNGQMLKFDLVPLFLKSRRTDNTIQRLLYDNKTVILAIIVSDVKNTIDTSAEWKESVKNALQARAESRLLDAYGGNENFAIVDRSRLNHILDELKLNQTGLISDKSITQIGKMTGAKYILDISIQRYRTGSAGIEDVTVNRLIDIESGKVLAIDNIKTRL